MKSPGLESLFNKVASLQICNFNKKTPKQLLSCEYCEILSTAFSYNTLVAASER